MGKKFRPVLACSIGSIDPTSAAGLTVDLAVYRALGVAGTCVVAGVTAQNASRVTRVEPLSARSVRDQLESIWEQARPQAVCIGLVPDVRAMRAIRTFFARRRDRPPIVVDPVIRASSGYTFYGPHEIAELRRLLSIATLVTPNVREASALSARAVKDASGAIEAATKIAAAGCAVLLTGYASGPRCYDILVGRNRMRRYGATLLHRTLRGSGGILAAAIAANLARGMGIEAAIATARAFVRRAFQNARRIGSGLPQYPG